MLTSVSVIQLHIEYQRMCTMHYETLQELCSVLDWLATQGDSQVVNGMRMRIMEVLKHGCLGSAQ
jgi:hypothetical protein